MGALAATAGASDLGFGIVEVPAIGLQWAPARPAIDGGMAAAIRDEAVAADPDDIHRRQTSAR